MSVTAVTSVSTPYSVVPYITVAEFKAGGTAVDYQSLVPGNADPVAQDDALAGIIADATGWVHRLCGQMILAATVDTEIQRVRVSPKGELFVHPDNWPVLEVRSLSYGSLPQLLTPLTDLSGVMVEPHAFTLTLPGVNFLTSNQGPLQFGPALMPDSQVWATWTYVNGYPNTLLASTATAGSSTVTVLDATGVYGGMTRLTIYDDGGTEAGLLVSSVAGNVVTLSAPLANTHIVNPGVSNAIRVSALPDQVKRATIALTAGLIKTRGNLSVVMDQVGGGMRKTLVEDETGLADAALAVELLEPFARYK
jgi:hypothetical protein